MGLLRRGFALGVSVIVIFFTILLLAVILQSLPALGSVNPLQQPLPRAAIKTAVVPAPTAREYVVTVKRGDTLAKIFKRSGLNYRQLSAVLKTHQPTLTHLKPGEKLKFTIAANHELAALQIPARAAGTLTISKVGKRYQATFGTKSVTPVSHRAATQLAARSTSKKLTYRAVTIQRTLFGSAEKAGIPLACILEYEKAFGQSRQLLRQLHRGDQIAMLYDHDHHVVVAELKTHGQTHRMVRYSYENHIGYYQPDGTSLEPRFLAAPLAYKRISSKFSYSRLDPVTHRVHSHLGVDLATAPGTPIRSIGDGIVTFKNWEGGYGKVVKVRYGKNYEALYAHMSRFASNLKLHQRVKKGEVIGYVGETGWATGPHLHFGFFVNGKPVNWLAFKLPSGSAIPSNYSAQFKKQSRQWLAELAVQDSTHLAENTDKSHREE